MIRWKATSSLEITKHWATSCRSSSEFLRDYVCSGAINGEPTRVDTVYYEENGMENTLSSVSTSTMSSRHRKEGYDGRNGTLDVDSIDPRRVGVAHLLQPHQNRGD